MSRRRLLKTHGHQPWKLTPDDVIASMLVQQQRRLFGIKDTPASALINGAKARAKKKGLPFDLDQHVALIQARLDAGVCELSGITFKFLDGPAQFDSPSIDRIVPELGYVYSNIRIICHGMNCALGTWGEARLMRMVAGYFRRMPVRHLLRVGGQMRGSKKIKPPKACPTIEEWRGQLALKILGLDADNTAEAERDDFSDVA